MQKGFTLVELLAVLAILVVISAITIPVVIKTLNNSKQNAYDLQISNIKEATKLYVADNKENIVALKEVGGIHTITLEALSSFGYIETPINNPLTSKYFDETTFLIRIEREANAKYNYEIIND